MLNINHYYRQWYTFDLQYGNLEVFMNCKNCIFFSGIECHGHGDFWGECTLLKLFIKCNKLTYRDYDARSTVCYEETQCKLSKLLKIKDE